MGSANRIRLFRRVPWILFITAGLLIGILFSGCSFKPRAIGSNNELAILIDAELRNSIESHLLQTFCPIIETPQPERRFIPIFGGADQIQNLQAQKFLLLVGVFDQEGEMSKMIANMLSPEVVQGVRDGKYYVFSKQDEWANGQLMLVLTAPDIPSLIDRLRSERESLFNVFDSRRSELTEKDVYHRYEQKDLAADIRERYGFDVRIPHDYVLVREEPDDGWLRLKRGLQPGRWITLWRSALFEEDPVDSAWVYQTWASLAAQFADPMRANLDFLKSRETEIAGYRGIEMRGLWETEDAKGGGPFLCRTFYCPDDRRVYMLEGEVFNPGGVKEPFIKQLEVILGTFKTPYQDATY